MIDFDTPDPEEIAEIPAPLPVGATIGILGGGQLGRMLSVAASRLGMKTHIFEPGENPPAGQVADRVTTAGYDDEAALRAFGEAVDVITYEFENIPTKALDILEELAPIRPNREALRISQDRAIEKGFIQSCGLNIAPHCAVSNALDLMVALETVGVPSILKTRTLGYDGKGQARLSSQEDAAAALEAVGNAPAILEGFVDFEREVSVIVARGVDGSVAFYDPGENVHKNGILATTTVPARLGENRQKAAKLAAQTIAEGLDYVGVMGVEMFVTASGLLVNEIAPRVHNSGHWTQNGCVIDQFEQHIRAIAGWPLGDGTRHSNVVMENLIGDDMDRVPELAADPANALHLYGKAEVKPGRKMGHVNRITGPAEDHS
ncbi:5-(carboxyamino)imidazole ribonucleotide synthase [Sinisalibacter lacisalsi]|uniref:N5-carboxyaminoimidazole ribonucleotide synthase n=1 Tax=Sinisalibacter lacisalsi TaxID=1526570 RepID=A0ABQ1QW76_9RHOB|nr:5-(carboxyamino)imidazole ribonucleotide synthase [Sinisalibacter lacisalsi]GGD46964.1 N5-carboxyaminoimidazole ribonucleotide synthase [Sinisalibacter lacisalsi]